MYLDGTWLSANGNHTSKPCLMSIGNHSIDMQHNLESKKNVCLWPDLGGSSTHKGKAAYGRYKRKLTHDLLYEIFAPVRAAQENGGFTFKDNAGGTVLAFPVMCLFISDTPERQFLSNIYNSAMAQKPCSMCETPGGDFPDVRGSFGVRLRTVEGTESTRVACIAARNTQQRLKENSRTCHVHFPCVLCCRFHSPPLCHVHFPCVL